MRDTSNGTLFTPLLIIGINVLVLVLVISIYIVVIVLYSHDALLLVNGDVVGHLLSIGMN